jgi:type 1 fimbriae regulatory protein FimB/type 1 fimbriae regulatory protein FimE
MILIGYRHGLRAFELCDLQWHQVELSAGRLHVWRVKSGTSSVHPLQGDELRARRPERGGPMTPKSFHALSSRIGVWAKLPFPIYPQCCGTVAATHWPTPATTLGRCRHGLGTRTSSSGL